MDMPKTIKVGPHVYSVLRKPASVLGNTLGRCDSTTLQIWVRQRLRKSKAQEILVHEALHSVLHSVANGGDKNTEEDFVEAASPVLPQVIQENPELLEYLTK